jgi:hypothetical protein
MIPPRLLKQLADNLTSRTKAGQISWARTSQDVQRYIYQLPKAAVVVHYSPSRGASDTIELAVLDNGGMVIGSLVAQEDEPSYDVLADLVFEIQRATDPGSHRFVTDEILSLLKS